ncbi:hypothetical protein CDL12_11017 [Handroanthus impetiginosus]|uniref:AP2/ERF domain-containing protein n=1 Tax=Handroanthus impetiginosus TaxID=429701 RepID=A0A2G9HFX2_9LAMI|nr:hypothetical protein CDL12_11017 [Handroanthus impetiginosus]
MPMRMIKSEETFESSFMSLVDTASEEKCIKRRRRDSAAAILTCTQQQTENENVNPKSAAKTVKRSSRFRGVSKHRWTGRYEAHLWDKLSWNVTQKKKGKQGAYDDEEAAARAYDLAALKYWGTSTFTNFPISDYEKEIEIMQTVTKEEYLASLRRRSSGFSRGVSRYRGVARHHHNGRWEARIGRVFGNKYLYLGTYNLPEEYKQISEHFLSDIKVTYLFIGTQEEAARAYDIAAIEYRGINAVTNFDLSNYIRWLKPGANISVPAQETKQSTDFVAREESLSPSLKRKAFSADDLQENFISKLPISQCGRSSPTALGLLLRSSVFRELLEKTSNVSEEDSDCENTKNQAHMGRDDECRGIFSERSEDIPFAVSTSGHRIELQEQLHFDYNCLDMVGTWPPCTSQ